MQIQTTAEADPTLDLELETKGLPPLAFIDNSDGLAATKARIVAVKRGVTPAQREAMRFGSMFGWGSRLATPQAWEAAGE